MNFSFTFTTQQLIYENVLLSFSFENERNRVSVFRRGLDIFTPIMSIKHQPFRVTPPLYILRELFLAVFEGNA